MSFNLVQRLLVTFPFHHALDKLAHQTILVFLAGAHRRLGPSDVSTSGRLKNKTHVQRKETSIGTKEKLDCAPNMRWRTLSLTSLTRFQASANNVSSLCWALDLGIEIVMIRGGHKPTVAPDHHPTSRFLKLKNPVYYSLGL
jgi:hypothetical protein